MPKCLGSELSVQRIEYLTISAIFNFVFTFYEVVVCKYIINLLKKVISRLSPIETGIISLQGSFTSVGLVNPKNVNRLFGLDLDLDK